MKSLIADLGWDIERSTEVITLVLFVRNSVRNRTAKVDWMSLGSIMNAVVDISLPEDTPISKRTSLISDVSTLYHLLFERFGLEDDKISIGYKYDILADGSIVLTFTESIKMFSENSFDKTSHYPH